MFYTMDISNTVRINKVMDLTICNLDAENVLPHPQHGEKPYEGTLTGRDSYAAINLAEAAKDSQQIDGFALPSGMEAVHTVKNLRNLDIKTEFEEKAGR